MRFLSMIRINEQGGVAVTPKLEHDMGVLMDEMSKEGTLVRTAGLRPTKEGVRVSLKGGQLSTSDGPFTETKEVIGGYALLEARDMAHAVELTRRFLQVHGDEWEITCEVRQVDGGEYGPEAPSPAGA